LPCRIWINPARQEFANAIQRSPGGATAGLRGLLTSTDLYTWQSMNLLHADFERKTGIEGVRVGLRHGEIQANSETIAHPEHFRWIFPDQAQAEQLDMEDRRIIVANWLKSNKRLKRIYVNPFQIEWYA
jgi:hypothetical protein